MLEQLDVPIVLAPLAGGPSTPALAAAVSEAGGLGFVASGYLSAATMEEQLAAARALTRAPLGVNVFAPGSGPAEAEAYSGFVQRLTRWAEHEGVEVGAPKYSDDDWEAKLEALTREPPAVVSFTFGCPAPETIRALRRAGARVWVTITAPEEAATAERAGADALIVQGAEAGGHRGSFADRPDLEVYSLLPLLALVRAGTALPLVASGGIATGATLAAVLAAGARAAQVGTAFMLAPEAGTSAAHRAALASGEPTVLTRAFTGRLARGIRNRFIDAHGEHAPVAYPELHYVTSPMRRRAREQGDPELINLWAGEAHQLAREQPADAIVSRLVTEAGAALRAAGALVSAGGRPPTGEELERIVRDWYAAWNAHDLERILGHYAEGVSFTSPLIARLGSSPEGRLVGKPRLRAYWKDALERFPDLRFEPLCELYGVGSVVLDYQGLGGSRAAEVMEFDDRGLVHRAAVHYDRLPLP